jgi:hypothetical protein
MKAWRASRWISLITMLWGSITMTLAAVHNADGLLAARFFLGLTEAGLFPGILYYLSMWYTRAEQAFRIAMFFGAATVAGAFSGFLAAGVTSLHGVGGLRGWQWLFLLEGATTVLIAFVCFWYLPDGPATAWFLTPSERILATERIAAEHADSGNVTWKDIQSVLLDWKSWCHMLMALGGATPFYCIALFLPSIVKGMGFTSLAAQAMSSPPYIAAFVVLTLNSWHSDRQQERGFHVAFPLIIASLGFLALALVRDRMIQYILIVLTVASLVAHVPIVLSWCSNNFAGAARRSVALALATSFNNVGGFVSGQLYRQDDAPYYSRGHMICAGLCLVGGVAALVQRFLLVRENIRRDRLALEHGIDESKTTGSDWHPSFRYLH